MFKNRKSRNKEKLLSEFGNLKSDSFDFENIESYVVFDLQDENTQVTRYQRPIEVSERTATGIVEGSLWETFDKNHINPVIATQLADVFASGKYIFIIPK